MSFTNKHSFSFTGTYSVSLSDTLQIKLIIKADDTFDYYDFSNSENKIVVMGNWKLRNGKLELKNDDELIKFPNVWTFVKNGQVAKSRKGLTFYRLCKIK